MKNIFHKSLIFLSVITLLLAGYSANAQIIKLKKKVQSTEKTTNQQDEVVVEAISFEATPSFFQSSFHRFSFLIFSFEFDLGKIIPQSTFFPKFINSFKQTLFSRISPTNAP